MATDLDPRKLRPGTVVTHATGGRLILATRKDDDSGWWNTDGSGVDDKVLSKDAAFTVTDERVEFIPIKGYCGFIDSYGRAAVVTANEALGLAKKYEPFAVYRRMELTGDLQSGPGK